jgi:hypothetical protein
MPAIRRVEQLIQACFANRKIRRDADGGAITAMTLADGKFVKSGGHGTMDFDSGDGRSRRSLRFQIADESFQPMFRAFEENLDSVFTIRHPASQSIGAREAIHKWTKAHALHYSVHSDGKGRHS